MYFFLIFNIKESFPVNYTFTEMFLGGQKASDVNQPIGLFTGINPD